MEQHPVPQNVTTFQFRLIGDMTLKQFGYLSSGAVVGYICLKLPLPFIFTWPLAGLFFFGGIGFAFIPIEERPMDVWVFSFLKRIYSPTQYLWSRGSPQPTAPSLPSTTLPRSSHPPSAGHAREGSIQPKHDFFSGLHIYPAAVHDPWSGIKKFFAMGSLKTSKSSKTDTFVADPSASLIGKHTVADMPAQQSHQAPPAPKEELPIKPAPPEHDELLEARVTTADTHILDLQKQLTELLEQNRKMQDELVSLRRGASTPRIRSGGVAQPPRQAPDAPAAHQPPEEKGQAAQAPTVKVMAPDAAVRAGLPRMTSFPNVITGITKDPEGNLLPGILVTVRDKDDVPLRALKTNKLGQFAASTPLPLGGYTIEIEDPRGRYTFDRAQIVVNDSVLPAIEIIAKSQKDIERARLAQQIFGNVNTD